MKSNKQAITKHEAKLMKKITPLPSLDIKKINIEKYRAIHKAKLENINLESEQGKPSESRGSSSTSSSSSSSTSSSGSGTTSDSESTEMLENLQLPFDFNYQPEYLHPEIEREQSLHESKLKTIRWLKQHGFGVPPKHPQTLKLLKTEKKQHSQEGLISNQPLINEDALYIKESVKKTSGIQYPMSSARLRKDIKDEKPLLKKKLSKTPSMKNAPSQFKVDLRNYDDLVSKWKNERVEQKIQNDKLKLLAKLKEVGSENDETVKPGDLLDYYAGMKKKIAEGVGLWNDPARSDSPLKSQAAHFRRETTPPTTSKRAIPGPSGRKETSFARKAKTKLTSPQTGESFSVIKKLPSSTSVNSLRFRSIDPIKLKNMESLNKVINSISAGVLDTEAEIASLANESKYFDTKQLKKTVQDIMKSMNSIKTTIQFPKEVPKASIGNPSPEKSTNFVNEKTESIVSRLNRIQELIDFAKTVKKPVKTPNSSSSEDMR